MSLRGRAHGRDGDPRKPDQGISKRQAHGNFEACQLSRGRAGSAEALPFVPLHSLLSQAGPESQDSVAAEVRV